MQTFESSPRVAAHSSAASLASSVAVCGAVHFLVDFACAVSITSPPASGDSGENYYFLAVLYNLLAFGTQPFWGWCADLRGWYRAATVAGMVATGLGAAMASAHSMFAAAFLGCGNALFHVGAGALVYLAAPGRAAGQGMFIAPGGVGLFTGILLGSRGVLSPLWLSPLLWVAAFGLMLSGLMPAGAQVRQESDEKSDGAVVLLVLLLVVVVARSFAGFAVPAPWKGVDGGLWIPALAAFMGKASGGFLADRLGWRRLCAVALIAAAGAVVEYRASLVAACCALFCFQATTGVTLAAIQSLFPGRPAFSFGLPCLALLVGAAPFFLPRGVGGITVPIMAAASLCAACAAFWALTIYRKKEAYLCTGGRLG